MRTWEGGVAIADYVWSRIDPTSPSRTDPETVEAMRLASHEARAIVAADAGVDVELLTESMWTTAVSIVEARVSLAREAPTTIETGPRVSA